MKKKNVIMCDNKPAMSRDVMNDPVYTRSTANPCSSCNLGTAFPVAIISSLIGVPPNLQWKGKNQEAEKLKSPHKQHVGAMVLVVVMKTET